MNEISMEEIFEGLCSDETNLRRQAIADLYAAFEPLLFKRLRYKFYSLSESDLRDIVQEAFLKILLTKSKPSSKESLRSWVFTVATNTALNLLRESYRQRELPWPQERDEEAGVSTPVENLVTSEFGTNTEGVIIAVEEPLSREVERCVADGMSKFGVKYPDRETTISLAMDGRSIQEIADLYNRTEHAMRQFIYESRKKLMPFIEHCLSEMVEG
uniref:RNA polymerase sigma factor n=1 Tax=Orrella sp. TaxID=1921583 RepID=UPI0040487361